MIAIAAIAMSVMNFLPSPQQLTILTPSPSEQVSPSPTPEEDSAASINQQIEDVTIEDVDSQFKDIDSDLNQL